MRVSDQTPKFFLAFLLILLFFDFKRRISSRLKPERSDHITCIVLHTTRHPLFVTTDRGEHRRNPSLQGRCADREGWCRRAVERRHASYLQPMSASALEVHGRLAEQGRGIAHPCERTTLVARSASASRESFAGCGLHARRPCCGEMDAHRPATTASSSHLPTLHAASGRVSRALHVCAAPDVGDRRVT